MPSIDRRVVEATFDNSNFDRNIETSMRALQQLDAHLDMSNAVESFSNSTKQLVPHLENITSGVTSIANSFSTLGIIGITALQNITNQAINTAEQMVKAFTITPVKSGFQEYETQINAIQTILANTESKGTTLDDVTEALDELNHYADETIYNFTEMTKNIGLFTAAGIDLDTSVSAIKGIANLGAVSGSTSNQVTNAMYQLSQALASGSVRLQDWKSVENMNMGGQLFQDAIKRTAESYGIDVDAMIEKYQSFRYTLQEGWLTSDILTESLAQFTTELTEEQLRSLGYTEEQISDIIKLGETATDAATVVKTFGQLFSTLAEESQSTWTQSWEYIIGDFEEAKVTLTEIKNVFTGVINAIGDSRNALLKGWHDLGGRDDLIISFRNAVSTVGYAVDTVSKAFREIFPPTTAEQLKSMTYAVRQFSYYLMKFVYDNSGTVYTALHILFSVAKFGIDAFSELAKVCLTLGKSLEPLGKSLLGTASDIASFFTSISSLSENTVQLGAFEFVGEVLTNTIKGLQESLASLLPMLLNTSNAISEVFIALTSGISNSLQGMNLEQITSFLFTAFAGAWSFHNINGVVGALDTFADTLESLQWKLRAESLLNIAEALAVLAVAMVLIASIDSDKLAATLASVSLMMAELFAFMRIFSVGDKGLIADILGMAELAGGVVGIAAGVAILAAAVKLLSTISFDEMTSALVLFTAIIGGLVATMGTFSKFEGKIAISALKLIGLASALMILSTSLKILGSVNTEHLLQSIGGLGLIFAELALFATTVSGTKGLVGMSISLNLVATSIVIFSAALSKLGAIPIESIGRGLVAIGGALAEIAVASLLMSKNAHLISTGAAIGIVAVSMVTLSQALSTLGNMSWSSVGKSLVALAGSLVIFAAGVKLLAGGLSGAAALLVISAALSIFAPVIERLGNLPFSVIALGLGTLVATFAILAGAAVLLTPVTPTILGLAGAIALLGVGIAGISIGVAAFGAALTALAAGGTALVAGLVTSISALISLIPGILIQIANGIVGFVKVLGESAVEIATAFTNILSSLLTAGTTLIPQFVEFGLTLITSLLQGISSRIEDITTAAVDIVIGFLNGLSSRMDDIVAAGFNFAATFISSVGNGISEGLPEIGSAIGDLVSGIVLGFANGIISGISSIVKNIIELGKSVIDALKDFLGIHSPSVKFQELGQYATEGFAIGLTDRLDKVRSAANKVASEALSKIDSYNKEFQQMGAKLITSFIKGVDSKSTIAVSAFQAIVNDVITVLDGYYNQFYNVGMYLDQGFANGIGDYAYLVIRAARQMAQDAYDAAMDELDAASPSKLFTTVGSYIPQGFALGIGSEQTRVKSAATSMADAAISTVNDAVSAIVSYMDDSIDTSPVIKPVLDISEVAKGAQSINTMLSRNQAIAASSGFIQNGVNSSSESVNGNNVYQFTQNNYSPKALSRLEIYRQTKNQFSALKGTV